VDRGPLAKNAIILDGYEIWGVPAAGMGGAGAPARKLFDLRPLGIESGPRGIAYIESENVFALVEPVHTDELIISDHRGRLVERRQIEYLGGYMPEHVEGLTYIPESSPVFPGHLALVTLCWIDLPTWQTRIQILRSDGQVVHEIVPDQPLGNGYGIGITHLAPDRLLVGECGYTGELYTMDFDGNFVADPIYRPPHTCWEGLQQIPDGRIISVEHETGKLFFHDQLFERLPEHDRDFLIGSGLGGTLGLAWEEGSGEFVVTFGSHGQVWLTTVPPESDTATPFAQPSDDGYWLMRGLTSLPDESLVAFGHRMGSSGPREIVLYDTSGNLTGTIDIFWVGFQRFVEFIAPTDEFAVCSDDRPGRIEILSRSGDWIRTIDLSSTGITTIWGLAFFNPDHPSGGQFLVNERYTRRGIVIDFDGNPLYEIDLSDVSINLGYHLSSVSSGPWAGALAGLDGDNSNIVIFTLP
jgi:hypothetical protein